METRALQKMKITEFRRTNKRTNRRAKDTSIIRQIQLHALPGKLLRKHGHKTNVFLLVRTKTKRG